MVMDLSVLQQLEDYIESGDVIEDFFNSPQERRMRILELLDTLMDLGESAGLAAGRIAYGKDSEG